MVAEAVWQTLGYEPEDKEWRTPTPPTAPPGWVARRAADASFARQHLLPWIGRRLTGRSSGDGRAGAQFSPELGKAFWVTPADHTNPGPVGGLAMGGALTQSPARLPVPDPTQTSAFL